MSKTVVVYGPQGCGKTHHSKALARHFGLKNVVDADDLWRWALSDGALVLTSHGEDKACKIAQKLGGTSVPFETAMEWSGFRRTAEIRNIGSNRFPNWESRR